MDEKKALRAMRRGDDSVLEWVINRYCAYVSTIVRNIIGGSMTASDVEEVVSDVFLTVWSNAHKIRPGALRAYLSGTARNKAMEKTRRAGFELPLEEDVLTIAGDGPERLLEAREQEKFIREAVLSLPEPEREIFLRHYYYCQSVSRISEETGINASTVKTKLRRGREKLKEVLRKGGYTVED